MNYTERLVRGPEDHESRLPQSSLLRTIGYAACSIALGSNLVGNIPSVHSDIDAYNDKSALTVRTSEIASQMVDKEIKVHCSDTAFTSQRIPAEVQAYVRPYILGLPSIGKGLYLYSGAIHAREDVCRAVNGALDANEELPMSADQASSLLILSHELEHINGTLNEAVATCYAAQKLPQQLSNLGFDKQDADGITSAAVRDAWYSVTEEYKSTECHEGGALDLKISDAYFELSENSNSIG